MLLSEGTRALVKTVDVGIELLSVDPPDTSPTDLDRGQLPRTNERVDLRHADVEIGRDILEGEEPRFVHCVAALIFPHDSSLSAGWGNTPDIQRLLYVAPRRVG